MPEKMIEIEESKLMALLDKNDEQEREIRMLYNSSISVLELLGLAENGRFKSEYFGEDSENPLPSVLKEVGSLMVLCTQAAVPVLGKNAEKKLTERFSFFKDLIPVFEKYGKKFKK